MPVEQSPVFLGWIEDWISGTIDMMQVQRRYLSWKALGSHQAPAGGPAPMDAFIAELSHEIPDISGLRMRDPQARLQSTEAISSAWDSE